MTALAHQAALSSHDLSSRVPTHVRAVAVAAFSMAIGSCFSFKLVDRLALSNAVQVVSLIILLAALPGLLRKKDAVFLVLTACAFSIAAWSMLAIYGYVVQWQYSVFYMLALVLVVAALRMRHLPSVSTAFLDGVRAALPVLAVYFTVWFVVDLQTGEDRRRLGFDDKSHAAVYLCILAFLSLRLLRGRWRLVMGLAFFTLSLLTISRLPYLFAPGILLAFLVEYQVVRRAARNALDVFVAHLLLAATIAAPMVLAATAGNLFSSAGRVFSAGDRTQNSTEAHLLLLQYAAQMKVQNPANFLVGVTPGGFSGVLARSGIDVSSFARTDPAGYEKVLQGVAPMHSSTGTILLEFPIWVGIAYLVLVAWLAITLWRRSEKAFSLMVLSLAVATSFYSSVTELYFAFAVATAIVATSSTQRRPIPMLREARRVRWR